MESSGQPSDPLELRQLLDENRPASLLRLLTSSVPPEFAVFKSEAFIELDRNQQALELLETLNPMLRGDSMVYAWCLQARVLVNSGLYDSAILLASQAAQATQKSDLQAEALATCATGYAAKRCWQLSELNLHEALDIAPTHPRVLVAQARMYLEADQRIEARRTYESMENLPSKWAKSYSLWGRSYIAYLMGEFDNAVSFVLSELDETSEVISPLYILAQVALARNDLARLEDIVSKIRRRSPQAEGIRWYEIELERLKNRLTPAANGVRRRLSAFPTIAQRRNFCGPSTVELVLQYWQSDLSLSTDQIADKIKYSASGTPLYRMREFFHLAGFDTIRCQAPVNTLQKIIDAGFPIVVQEEYPSSSHVAVVIGYDNVEGIIELQDPMTHIVTTLPVEKLNQLRLMYLDSALIAFPRGQDLEKRLARIDIFDDQAFILTDQAVLEIENGRYPSAISLLEKAIRRKPDLSLSWILLLQTIYEEWMQLLAKNAYPNLDDKNIEVKREKFYSALQKARNKMPGAEFIFQFAGLGAIADNDYNHALENFLTASSLDVEDARNYAFLAECYFGLRNYQSAKEAARDGLRLDPSLPAVNIWLARSMSIQGDEKAFHYAQAAVDLDPDNWLAHLALAEASLSRNNLPLARQEAITLLSLAPFHPEARLIDFIVKIREGNSDCIERQILDVLQEPRRLSPSTLFRLYQSLGDLYFNDSEFQRAVLLAQRMLDLFPGDPWALKLLAAGKCEEFIKTGCSLNSVELSEVTNLYMEAVTANDGNDWVIRNFLSYLETLADSNVALHVIRRLRKLFPHKAILNFLFGRLYRKLGDEPAAANAMLRALKNDGGLNSRQEISEAVEIVLATFGIKDGFAKILALPNDKGVSLLERKRAIGLLLATLPGDSNAFACDLLQQVLDFEPTDIEVILALGDAINSNVEREKFYRKALMVSPTSWLARANLCKFLVEQGRSVEALEFSRGHEHDSSEMMVVHGRALLEAGYYEDAVETFRSLILNNEHADYSLYFWLWKAETCSGRPDQALRTARRSLVLFPQELLWYLHTAESLRSLGRFDESIRVIRRGKAKGLDEQHTLVAEYETAIARQQLDSALSVLDQLVVIQGQSKDGYLTWSGSQRFRLLIVMGYLEEAITLIHSQNLKAYAYGEAALLAYSVNNFDVARELSQQALCLDPNIFSALLVNAQLYMISGRNQEAIQALLNLRDGYPDEHETYERLAILWVIEGQLAQGMIFAEEALNLGPFCPYAWAIRGLVWFLNDHFDEAVHDLTIAWNRMNARQRDESIEYWYLLAYLHQDEIDMNHYWDLLVNRSLTPVQQRILESVQAKIAN